LAAKRKAGLFLFSVDVNQTMAPPFSSSRRDGRALHYKTTSDFPPPRGNVWPGPPSFFFHASTEPEWELEDPLFSLHGGWSGSFSFLSTQLGADGVDVTGLRRGPFFPSPICTTAAARSAFSLAAPPSPTGQALGGFLPSPGSKNVPLLFSRLKCRSRHKGPVPFSSPPPSSLVPQIRYASLPGRTFVRGWSFFFPSPWSN